MYEYRARVSINVASASSTAAASSIRSVRLKRSWAISSSRSPTPNGGTAGVLVHTIVPGVPAALAVAAMIAALPGAVIGAPVSFVLIGVVTVGIGVESLAPISIAVITAHASNAALRLHLERMRH